MNIPKGIVAGLVATVVLSTLMVMKNSIGMLPEMDLIKMLAGMMGGQLQDVDQCSVIERKT